MPPHAAPTQDRRPGAIPQPAPHGDREDERPADPRTQHLNHSSFPPVGLRALCKSTRGNSPFELFLANVVLDDPAAQDSLGCSAGIDRGVAASPLS